MRALVLVSVLAACGGDGDSAPVAADLYGRWAATADNAVRSFYFRAIDDGSHPELAGLADVYTLENDGAQVQTGSYTIEERAVTGHGTTDALVTSVRSGAGTGSTFGNAILDWTGETLTLSSETATAGELVFTRAFANRP